MKTYNELCNHVKFDDAFFKRLLVFKTNWERKGDHMLFLAGGTIGEQKLTFSIIDEEELFTEVYRLDSRVVKEAYQGLKTIDTAHRTEANHKHMLMIYTIVRAYQAKASEEKRNEWIYIAYAIFFFMKISSLISGSTRFSNFLADPDAAQTTYEALPNRYIIKQKGNWQRVIRYVATDFYSRKHREKYENGINYERIQKPTDDNMLAMTMHMSTKLNGYINNIYGVYRDILDKGLKGGTTSIIDDFGEEGTTIRDIVNNSKYVTFIKDVVNTRTDFTRPKLAEYVCSITGAESEHLIITLNYMSDNYLDNFKEMEFILKTPIIHGIAYLDKNEYRGKELNRVIDDALEDLNNKWRVGKGQEEEIYEFKEVMPKYVRNATGKVTPNLLTAITISVGIYIFVRAIAGNRV